MKFQKSLEEFFIGWLILLLAAITISAIYTWSFTEYFAYTFFISWGLFFIYHIVVLRNYFSLILLGLATGAGGLYLSIKYGEVSSTESALLIGKIALTVFTALLAYRLYKIREELEANNILYLVLVGLLVFQVIIQDVKQIDALSIGGFVNYFTVGVIANILLNGHLSKHLKKGERVCLVMVALFSLYSISIMFIANFSA